MAASPKKPPAPRAGPPVSPRSVAAGEASKGSRLHSPVTGVTRDWGVGGAVLQRVSADKFTHTISKHVFTVFAHSAFHYPGTNPGHSAFTDTLSWTILRGC